MEPELSLMARAKGKKKPKKLDVQFNNNEFSSVYINDCAIIPTPKE